MIIYNKHLFWLVSWMKTVWFQNKFDQFAPASEKIIAWCQICTKPLSELMKTTTNDGSPQAKHMLQIKFMITSSQIALRWMP